MDPARVGPGRKRKGPGRGPALSNDAVSAIVKDISSTTQQGQDQAAPIPKVVRKRGPGKRKGTFWTLNFNFT